MNPVRALDAEQLLRTVAAQVNRELRDNVVVIGSVAVAWAFRDVSQTTTVATKDIDLLLHPAVAAVATARSIGEGLLQAGWEPQYSEGRAAGTSSTADDDLPVLRVAPPDRDSGWFIELLSLPPPGQARRRQFVRFETNRGHFGLPSFRYLPIAVRDADETPFGLRVARPEFMALAHLLEHADPDRTPVSSLPGRPPRFVKDIGRAISIWWLAGEQTVSAPVAWHDAWRRLAEKAGPYDRSELKRRAILGLANVADEVTVAHEVAVTGVLAPHGTTRAAFERAYDGLSDLVRNW